MGSITTTSYRTAAALMSYGYSLSGTNAKDRLIVFEIEIPDEQMHMAKIIVDECRGETMDIQVHLGRYEAAFRSLKRIMRAHQPQQGKGRST